MPSATLFPPSRRTPTNPTRRTLTFGILKSGKQRLGSMCGDRPAEGSEIWASWNPRRKSDAIDQFLRGAKLDNAIVVKANWRDNPWFPSVLDFLVRKDQPNVEGFPARSLK